MFVVETVRESQLVFGLLVTTDPVCFDVFETLHLTILRSFAVFVIDAVILQP